MVSKTKTNYKIAINMAALRDVRNAILFGIGDGLLDEDEGILLYDINKSKNIDYP